MGKPTVCGLSRHLSVPSMIDTWSKLCTLADSILANPTKGAQPLA